MEKADRKRPRELKDEDTTIAQPPAYGSQDYWENRYKRQQTSSKKLEDAEDQPAAFHAWYFTYDELAPLILPLILGDTDVEEKDADDDTSGLASMERNTTAPTLTDSTTVSNREVADDNTVGRVQDDQVKDDDAGDEDENVSDVDGNDDDIESRTSYTQGEEYELVEVDIEGEEEGLPRRDGLAKCGPIEVLEVGCGDVPLGNDIVFGISEYVNSVTSNSPCNVLKRVVCVDYAENVIEALKTKQKSNSTPAMIPLEYECKDARKLPYKSGRFQLILEKGTMDAMLSEPDDGADNCRAIVAEMARLVAIEGVIMVISHLNAHTEEGMQWFNTIVVPGLRTGSVSTNWSIEVHGGEHPEIPEDENKVEEDMSIGYPGPAVYIIHKGQIMEGVSSMTDEAELPPISLQFFSH